MEVVPLWRLTWRVLHSHGAFIFLKWWPQVRHGSNAFKSVVKAPSCCHIQTPIGLQKAEMSSLRTGPLKCMVVDRRPLGSSQVSSKASVRNIEMRKEKCSYSRGTGYLLSSYLQNAIRHSTIQGNFTWPWLAAQTSSALLSLRAS